MEKYTVDNIYEADFGCEERREDERLKVIVHLTDEQGQKTVLEEEDEWLKNHRINEGSRVIQDASGRLKKAIDVVAAVIKGNNENAGSILATKRGYGEFAGGWEFPGGKIEKGETPEVALKREIMEELETEIEVGELIDTVEYEYTEFWLSMRCYWCEIVSGNLELKEHEAARWLTKEQLYSVEWLPADVALVKKLEKQAFSQKQGERA